jgi:hypothetical protein
MFVSSLLVKGSGGQFISRCVWACVMVTMYGICVVDYLFGCLVLGL